MRRAARGTRSARVLARAVREPRRYGDGAPVRYGAGVTEEPLPRLYGDFELARLICANATGRIYRGFFRGHRASNVRVFSRMYTSDEAATTSTALKFAPVGTPRRPPVAESGMISGSEP